MNYNPVCKPSPKGLQTRSVEERKEIARKGGEAYKQNNVKRKAFKEIFDESLTPELQEHIVKSFFNILLGSTSKDSDKLKAMELLLKILGEDGMSLSKTEIGQVEKIVLKFN